MYQRFNNFPTGLRAFAHARIIGDEKHPDLRGSVDFFPWRNGVLVAASLWGLPYDDSPCAANICAMHIHEKGDCSGSGDIPFSAAKGHYNPTACPHPAHAGDLAPLFSNRGYAWQTQYTERFSVSDIIGKTVIIHENRDDFTSQPAGDAGERIGCGVIVAVS